MVAEESTIIVNPLITNIVSIVVALLLVATLLLPKLIRNILHSLLLMTFGIIPFLYEFYIIDFNIPSWPILRYVLMGIVIMSSRSLIVDGFEEENKVLKIASITGGVIVLITATMPALSAIGALTFDFALPEVATAILYTISGILLIIGTIMMRE